MAAPLARLLSIACPWMSEITVTSPLGEISTIWQVSSTRNRARNLHRTLRVAHPTHARATRDVRLASALIVAFWEMKSSGVLLEAVVGLMSGRSPSFDLRDEHVICSRRTSHVCRENQSPRCDPAGGSVDDQG